MPEIFAEAIIPETSPSDVVIVPLTDASSPVTPPVRAPRIALARCSGPELTAWIRDAINLLLAELPLSMDRPAGDLLERGTFRQLEEQVWVDDWYGGGAGLLVARCDDVETARRPGSRAERAADGIVASAARACSGTMDAG